MKLTTKYSLLFVGLVFFTQISKAQDDRNLRVGFKVMPGFDWVKSKTPNTIQKDGVGIGFSFGLMADLKLADNYFFSPEIIVTSMSNKTQLRDTNIVYLKEKSSGAPLYYNNVNHKYNLKYLEIPLTFKFRTNEINHMRYWLQVGVSPGVLISHSGITTATASLPNTTPYPISEKYQPNVKENDQYDFYDKNEDGEYRVEDDINVLRLSMILGAGIEYNLGGNTSFYMGFRFNNGFTDMLNDKKSKMINNVLGLEIGIYF